MGINWKSIVRTVAPGIATALGGPLAGMATRVIGGALLGKEDAAEEDIIKAVMLASPGDLLKLKEAEMTFQLEMERLKIDIMEIDAGDRDSARKREMAVGSVTTNLLAGMIVAGAFAVGASVLFGWSEVDSALAGAVLGYAFGEMKQVTTYYFGSSAGSKMKTAILSKMGVK